MKKIGIVDYIGLTFAGICMLWSAFVVLFIVSSFTSMFEDFGGTFPPLTKLFRTPWFTPTLVLIAPTVVVAGIIRNVNRRGCIAWVQITSCARF